MRPRQRSGVPERTLPLIVSLNSSEPFNVRQVGACSCPAARRCAGRRLRATDAAGWIGRRGKFGHQRSAVRSRQSPRAQRPQRYRQRLENPSAWHQHAGVSTPARSRTGPAVAIAWGSALRGCVTAHHQPAPRGKKTATAPPPRPSPGSPLHGDLPRLLAIIEAHRGFDADHQLHEWTMRGHSRKVRQPAFLAILRSASSIRDCQPGPLALKCEMTSGLRRMDTATFVGVF